MLNLLHLKQTGLVETPESYTISATVNLDPPECVCFFPKVVRNGTKKVSFQDTQMHGKRVEIEVSLQRYKCQGCESTLYPDVPHMHERHRITQRLFDHICKLGTHRSWTALATEVGMDPQTVSDIWNKWADEKIASFVPVTPTWLGIDELYIMGKYRGIITNVRDHTLVNMLEERDVGTLLGYFQTGFEREKVELITMDMWKPYRDVAKIAFPQAKIIVDRFHVARYATQAVDHARKALRKDMASKRRRSGLLYDRWLFLANKESLSALRQATLDAVLQEYPTIADAYRLKEAFRDIWNGCTEREEAGRRLDDWQKQIEASQSRDLFLPLTKLLGNWREEILNYVQYRLTNAYTESFNALARRMDNVGHGYSFNGLRKRLMMRYSVHKHEEAAAKSTSGAAAFLTRGRWLGLDLSTLDDEAATLPKD